MYISLFRRALSFDHTLYNFELTEAKASLRSQLSCNGTKLPLNSGSLRTDILIGLLHKIYILQLLIFLLCQSLVFPLLYVNFSLKENKLQIGLK